MDLPWSDVASLSAAALSAVAATGAWMAARRANKTAQAVARIERERWHADLTPQFDISLVPEGSTSRACLNVHLSGPGHLRHLDEVTIAVGNDDMDHTVLNPTNSLTQEMADAHIWGPFRFVPCVDGADENGRAVAAIPLTVGRGRHFAMERSRPGVWMEGLAAEQWQQRYVNRPVRLVLTCRRGDEEWVIAREVDNPPL